MTQQVINIGASEGDGTGDKARIFTDKINDNFVELYTGPAIHVDNYGTVGDGTTNDAAAILAAIAALPSSDAILRFGYNKIYGIGAGGIAIASKTRIKVDFNGAKFKQLATATQTAGSFPALLLMTSCTECEVYSGTHDGNSKGGAFIALDSCTDCTIRDCISYSVGNATDGNCQFGSINGLRNVWRNNEARDAGASSAVRGFWLGGTNASQIENNLIVVGNKAKDNTATGIVAHSVGAQVRGNYSLSNDGAGIISVATTNGASTDQVISGNVCRGNLFHGYQTDPTGTFYSERITFTGNDFSGNEKCGMYINLAKDFTITGNVIATNNTSNAFQPGINVIASNRILISGNTFKGDTNYGQCVSLGSAGNICTDVAITDNIMTATPGRLINLESVSATSSFQRILVANNILVGGVQGVYVRATDAAAVIADVTIANNISNGASSNSFLFLSVSEGQITGLKVLGNIGASASVSALVLFQLNRGNTWNTGVYNDSPYAAGNTGTTPAPDCAKGLTQTWTMNNNITVGAPTNAPAAGQALTLIFTQDATGTRTIAWNATYRNAPAWSAGTNAQKASAVFHYNGTGWQFVGGSSAFA